jgi:asparagine synthase (glutamine-hydrolysing)
MCGIAGIVGTREVAPEAVQAMIDRLAHRGPDSEGVWSAPDRRVILGHRRLAVLDPTPRGRQPMSDPSGRAVVTFNGEIYNYLEIGERLRAEGVTLTTGTDTEVLLHAYLRWGDDCLADFNGMFAFCLYDRDRRRILCARDRFAEKPFLFARGPDFFAFASEYKALLALAEIPDTVDERRILAFLRRSRAGLDDGRETAFPAIRQLRGGEKLVLDLDSLSCRITPFWRLTRDPALARLDDAEAAARLRELLTDSIRLRMRSDVEHGSCLSGGLDSSAIVCLARRILGEDAPYHVFSGRFPGTAADEGPYVEQVIAATGVTAHPAHPTANDLLARLDAFIWFNELPVGSTSQFAQWCVFERARQAGVTVLLDGQGGDEVLGGYEPYFEPYLAALRAGGEATLATREAAAIRRRYPLALPRLSHRIKRSLPFGPRLASARAGGWGSDFAFGLADPTMVAEVEADSPSAGTAPDPLSAALEDDAFRAHLPALLRYGDRNSMAHSREVRLPFCDHRLAEFALSLAPARLMGGAETKHLLRRALRGIVPEAILTRWNKQGFLPPQEEWFRTRLADVTREVIHDPAFARRGWWHVPWWRRVLARFSGGESHLAWVLWKAFVAEAWCRHFLEPVRATRRVSAFAEPPVASPAPESTVR